MHRGVETVGGAAVVLVPVRLAPGERRGDGQRRLIILMRLIDRYGVVFNSLVGHQYSVYSSVNSNLH